MTYRRSIAVVVILCAALAVIGRCNRLPDLGTRAISTAITDTGATRLGKAVAPLVVAHPGHSGIYPLRDARDAFAARFLLASAAERSLDVQYYIWRNDMSGTLLFKAMFDAAQQGVRVRLLLDDNNTSGLDTILAALDSHARIEVRLFNPFAVRRPRALGYVTGFARLNRRMHNKSFTADNQVTIVGGRNVGDEYFGATDGVLFSDLDVIAVGPVVRETSTDFDRYWASASSYPAQLILPSVDAAQIGVVTSAAERVERDPAAVAYMNALHASPFVRELIGGRLPLEWGPVSLISDDPAKGLGRAAQEDLIVAKLKQVFGNPSERMGLISPYFVPGKAGVELFTGWTRRGMQVRILTNSLEATDVAAVHAGYARRRKALLAAGVTLYELRRSPGARPASGSGPFGSSGSSLHAKTFAVDGARAFVGSFNFDPRSAQLNTEMGFAIHCPALAGRVETAFNESIPFNSYEVRLSEEGELYWLERHGGSVIRHDTEPGTTALQRASVQFLCLLPIEWLL